MNSKFVASRLESLMGGHGIGPDRHILEYLEKNDIAAFYGSLYETYQNLIKRYNIGENKIFKGKITGYGSPHLLIKFDKNQEEAPAEPVLLCKMPIEREQFSNFREELLKDKVVITEYEDSIYYVVANKLKYEYNFYKTEYIYSLDPTDLIYLLHFYNIFHRSKAGLKETKTDPGHLIGAECILIESTPLTYAKKSRKSPSKNRL